jgi:hypothetical protein
MLKSQQKYTHQSFNRFKTAFHPTGINKKDFFHGSPEAIRHYSFEHKISWNAKKRAALVSFLVMDCATLFLDLSL